MSNTYRAITPEGEAYFEEGVFERDFTPTEEGDWLRTGWIEIVPRTYRATSRNYSQYAAGEEFTAAMLKEHEAALIQGGHIERVDPEPEAEPEPKPEAETKPAKKTAAKKTPAKRNE